MKKSINKNLIFITTIGFIVLFAAGFFVGKSSVPKVNIDEVETKTLAEVDETFNKRVEQAEQEKTMFLIDPSVISKGKNFFLGGIVESVDYEERLFAVKVYNNIYQGGSLTSFLSEPTFFIKTVAVSESAEIKMFKPIEEGEDTIPVDLMGMPEMIQVNIEKIRKGAFVDIETSEEFALKDPKTLAAKIIFVQ